MELLNKFIKSNLLLSSTSTTKYQKNHTKLNYIIAFLVLVQIKLINIAGTKANTINKNLNNTTSTNMPPEQLISMIIDQRNELLKIGNLTDYEKQTTKENLINIEKHVVKVYNGINKKSEKVFKFGNLKDAKIVYRWEVVKIMKNADIYYLLKKGIKETKKKVGWADNKDKTKNKDKGVFNFFKKIRGDKSNEKNEQKTDLEYKYSDNHIKTHEFIYIDEDQVIDLQNSKINNEDFFKDKKVYHEDNLSVNTNSNINFDKNTKTKVYYITGKVRSWIYFYNSGDTKINKQFTKKGLMDVEIIYGFNKNISFMRKFDEEGLLKIEMEYKPDGSKYRNTVFFKNKQVNIEKKYQNNDKIWWIKEFNEEGLQTSEKMFDYQEQLMHTIAFNEKGQPISKTEYNPDKTVKSVTNLGK